MNTASMLAHTPRLAAPAGPAPASHTPAPRSSEQSYRNTAAYYEETMQMDTMRVSITTDDGKSLSIEKQQVSYTRTGAAVSSTASSTDKLDPVGEMVKQIVSQLRQVKEHAIKELGEATHTDKKEDADAIAEVPAYWNAENTATRIVDFATQFFPSFEGERSEYGEIIRDAIDKGFQQAKEMLGELPGPVGNLIAKTHETAMAKLDAWIEQDEQDTEAEATSQPGDMAQPTHVDHVV